MLEKLKIEYFVSLISAFLATILFLEVFIRNANKLGLIDKPGYRKIHNNEIPTVGGISIVSGFVFVIFLFSLLTLFDFINIEIFNVEFLESEFLLCIIFSSIVIFITGLIDDIRGLSASSKFVFQFIAAIIVVFGAESSNIEISFIGIGQSEILSMIFSVIYIVGITNAINLIDGLDGLAGGVSLIIAISFLGLGIIAPGSVEVMYVLVLAAVIGALMAFLIYNKEPAKTFLGDTGSLMLGWTFAILSMFYSQKTSFTLSILIPIMVLGLPAFDVFFVMLKRFFTRHEYGYKGRISQMFIGDQNHLHHLLLSVGLSKKMTVLILYLITTVTCGIAIYFYFNNSHDNDQLNIMYALIGVFSIIFIVRMLVEWKAGRKKKYKDKNNAK